MNGANGNGTIFGIGVRVMVAVLLLAGVSFGLAQDKEKDKDKKRKGGEAEEVKSGLGAFGKFLPVGRTNEGVTIPSFDNGVRTSLVRAEKMMRVDEEHLQMDEMVIEMYTPTGEVETKIAVHRALFHMASSVMTSRSRSRVERKDFEIEGDAMVFDTKSQQGRMVGNVSMDIFDVKEFGAQMGGAAAGTEEVEEGAEEAPVPGE